MKKILIYILMIVVAITMLDISTIGTYAAKKTCAHSGCDRGVDSGSYCRLHKCGKSGCNSEKGNNGTIYCDTHASEYARKEGYKTCSVSGCMRKAASDCSYCYDHKCKESGCSSKKVDGSDYCSYHQPKKKTSTTSKSTTKKSSSSNTKKSSSSSTTKKSSSSSTTKKSSSKSTTTKKKCDPYDVYSYKSAEEFADDKYEEFFDYEDDYEDDDDAHDAAIEYWKDHH